MDIHTNMPKDLIPFYKKELEKASKLFIAKNYVLSFRHLERAHILAQPYPYEHTYVHWRMLCFGIKIKNTKEVLGQLPRLIFGGVKSFVGKIPVGNTGGVSVPPLKPMEIPSDLLQIINETNMK